MLAMIRLAGEPDAAASCAAASSLQPIRNTTETSTRSARILGCVPRPMEIFFNMRCFYPKIAFPTNLANPTMQTPFFGMEIYLLHG